VFGTTVGGGGKTVFDRRSVDGDNKIATDKAFGAKIFEQKDPKKQGRRHDGDSGASRRGHIFPEQKQPGDKRHNFLFGGRELPGAGTRFKSSGS